jgi:asparaginyl-tRNA synthetase
MKDEKLIAALRVQSVALAEIRETFRKKGLVEIMPVILSTTSDPLGPDPGSSIIGKPLIEYQGQSLVLTQSMILHSK